MRNLTVSVLLALCLTGSAFADNTAAVTPATTTPVTAPAATAGQPAQTPEQPAVPATAAEVPVQEI